MLKVSFSQLNSFFLLLRAKSNIQPRSHPLPPENRTCSQGEVGWSSQEVHQSGAIRRCMFSQGAGCTRRVGGPRTRRRLSVSGLYDEQ